MWIRSVVYAGFYKANIPIVTGFNKGCKSLVLIGIKENDDVYSNRHQFNQRGR